MRTEKPYRQEGYYSFCSDGGLKKMSWLLFGLLVALTAGTSEGDAVTVTTGRYTKVIIGRSTEGPNCTVCVGEGSSQTCLSRYTISETQTIQVTFTCSSPQDIFTIEINRDFDCSKTCNYGPIQTDWPFFQDFNRTFNWDMRVSSSKSFQLEFPAPGIKQIQSKEQCPDKHTYSLLMYLRAGPMNLGTFCQNGTINRISVLWKGRFTLVVPKDISLNLFSFNYAVATGSELAVDAVLPRGQSDTDFLSATGMPSDYTMKWNFVLPPKHNFTVKFVSYGEPECQSKDVKVTYQQDNMAAIEKTPKETQPANYQGNFNLTLTNCVLKSTAAVGDQKPLLNFRVSVFRSGFPDLCSVDLQDVDGPSLQIEKKNVDPFCEMRMDAVVQEKIVVPAGSKAILSFLDCPMDDLILTATQTMECQSLSLCPVHGTPLTIPFIDSCLSLSLSQVTWVLNIPEQHSVELRSPQGNLYQSVPGMQQCNGMSALVSAANGVNIGRFCSDSNGIIQRVQISSNVTITATADGDKDLRQEKAPILNVSLSSNIAETLIYTVSPLISTSALLMTPNWPGGMKPDSTLSWIVNVPEDYQTQLCFINVSRPQCSENHAEVNIQELGSHVELGFREDDRLLLEHNIMRSFYLNMSNCEPEDGKFAILSKISLQKKPSKLLSIILGVVGALLAVLIIILAVVCVVVRKKKRQMNNRSSICIPKGIASLPGDASFPKSRADNESHVYTYIDDSMVYGHLMQQDGNGPGQFNGHQVDSYQTFTNPIDKMKDIGYEQNAERRPDQDKYYPFLAPSETFIPSRPHTPLGPVDSMGYEDRRMVDNELYTFKNPGESNPLRHSAAEPACLTYQDTYSEHEEFVYDEAM